MSNTIFVVIESDLNENSSIVWDDSFETIEEAYKAVEEDVKEIYDWESFVEEFNLSDYYDKNNSNIINLWNQFYFEIKEINLPSTCR